MKKFNITVIAILTAIFLAISLPAKADLIKDWITKYVTVGSAHELKDKACLFKKWLDLEVKLFKTNINVTKEYLESIPLGLDPNRSDELKILEDRASQNAHQAKTQAKQEEPKAVDIAINAAKLIVQQEYAREGFKYGEYISSPFINLAKYMDIYQSYQATYKKLHDATHKYLQDTKIDC